MVDTSYVGIHHSKYLMPIHYDTIEDGQNKKSHLLFSNYSSLSPLSWDPLILTLPHTHIALIAQWLRPGDWGVAEKLRGVWTQIFLKHTECCNFQTITVMYTKVYVSGMKMSHRIHCWYQILSKILIFLRKWQKRTLFCENFCDKLTKITLILKCPNFWKIT